MNRSFLSVFSVLLWFFTLVHTHELCAQNTNAGISNDTTHSFKTKPLIAAASVLYIGSLFGLNEMWYKDYPRSGFHFINDNKEWLQMDKAGHATSAYSIGRISYESLRWTGISEKRSIWIGGVSSLLYLSTVEAFDGFSAQWGASAGDMVANVLGSSIFVTQQLFWHEQKVQLKWSYHASPYAKHNPAQLGKNTLTRILKDYNGQTYWLSVNIASLGMQNSKIPNWLNIAFGYGAEGMTGAYSNIGSFNGSQIPDNLRRRQFYISPDINISKIKTKSKALHWLLSSAGFLKFPLPGLVLENQKIRFVPICF